MFPRLLKRAGKLGGRELCSVGDYEYELRRGGAVIATGRIHLDEAPSPGDELAIGPEPARVEDVLPLPGMPRLILEQS
jgi:hypothetical protein